MIPVMGELRHWHFRHEEGERCAEYFAAIAEEFISEGVERARRGEAPYLLKIEHRKDIDLANAHEVLLGSELDGRRVDIALISALNRINIVIARRGSDREIPRGSDGLWLAIDVTHEDEGRLISLQDGITFDRTWMAHFGFAKPLVEQPKPGKGSRGQGRSPISQAPCPTYEALPAARSLGPDPDARRPGETYAEHQERLRRLYPWMRRRP